MKKNSSYWAKRASVLGIWLLGAISGHCFCSPAGCTDELPVSGAANSKLISQRQCDPFGEVTCATGRFLMAGPFRFPAKAQGEETDLLYYGYRYYNASGGRWLSRDPLEETGGENIYGFVANSPATEIDFLGMSFSPPEWPGEPPIPDPPLDEVSYSADGETFSNGHIGGYEEEAAASGPLRGTVAWFTQNLKVVYCPNGLCNSTLDPEHGGSTFVDAKVKNNTRCNVCLSCACTVYWSAMTWVPKSSSNKGVKGGFLSKGTILNKNFNNWVKPESRPAGWISQDSRTEIGSLDFCLSPGHEQLLYKGYVTISLPGYSGAIMNSHMSGSCFCDQK